MLATAGAPGVVIWPFGGNDGPMGKQAMEIGFDETALVTRVAADPDGTLLGVGLGDGRLWVCDVESGKRADIRIETGPPITALALAASDLRGATRKAAQASPTSPSRARHQSNPRISSHTSGGSRRVRQLLIGALSSA